MNSIEEEQ